MSEHFSLAKDSILAGKQHIHFIGIGGSGMFPLAQILHGMGFYLTGSDNNETETLAEVRAMGIPVFMGQRAENIEGSDLIVHTAAIMSDNPELIAAKASGVPVLERSELLGLVTKSYDNAVCVSGTHGKTTTSSMLAEIMRESGEDFGCVIGGKLRSIGGSGRTGNGDKMVCESCEFVDTFLKLYPDIAIILNIDADHLDYFKTMDNLKASFHKFAGNATKCLIYNGDDANTLEAVSGIEGKDKITFGWSDKNDYYPVIHEIRGLLTTFSVFHKGTMLFDAEIHVPGKHNVLNATAAIAACRYLGISDENIIKGLAEFKGAERRFEKLAEVDGITIADDYAHHPREIEVTLQAAKGLGFNRIIAVHQPFTYSRTYTLMDDFARVLKIADLVVLTEIMGSREKNTYGVKASDLAEKIDGCVLTPTFDECLEFLRSEIKPGDLVITMGCGDIYKVSHKLSKILKEERSDGRSQT
ncbi:MAG: UDP-N-acetylmuramate--L-alanine ligase [Ruminococcus sp.]|nr:UDP-N-acetylmuramate--L-alanine ligase [Ruminococcus sp.]